MEVNSCNFHDTILYYRFLDDSDFEIINFLVLWYLSYNSVSGHRRSNLYTQMLRWHKLVNSVAINQSSWLFRLHETKTRKNSFEGDEWSWNCRKQWDPTSASKDVLPSFKCPFNENITLHKTLHTVDHFIVVSCLRNVKSLWPICQL